MALILNHAAELGHSEGAVAAALQKRRSAESLPPVVRGCLTESVLAAIPWVRIWLFNYPPCRWIRTCRANYAYGLQLAEHLSGEYTFRFGRPHPHRALIQHLSGDAGAAALLPPFPLYSWSRGGAEPVREAELQGASAETAAPAPDIPVGSGSSGVDAAGSSSNSSVSRGAGWQRGFLHADLLGGVPPGACGCGECVEASQLDACNDVCGSATGSASGSAPGSAGAGADWGKRETSAGRATSTEEGDSECTVRTASARYHHSDVASSGGEADTYAGEDDTRDGLEGSMDAGDKDTRGGLEVSSAAEAHSLPRPAPTPTEPGLLFSRATLPRPSAVRLSPLQHTFHASAGLPPGCSPAPLAMPPRFWHVDAVAAYRAYYNGAKVSLCAYTRRARPPWLRPYTPGSAELHTLYPKRLKRAAEGWEAMERCSRAAAAAALQRGPVPVAPAGPVRLPAGVFSDPAGAPGAAAAATSDEGDAAVHAARNISNTAGSGGIRSDESTGGCGGGWPSSVAALPARGKYSGTDYRLRFPASRHTALWPPQALAQRDIRSFLGQRPLSAAVDGARTVVGRPVPASSAREPASGAKRSSGASTPGSHTASLGAAAPIGLTAAAAPASARQPCRVYFVVAVSVASEAAHLRMETGEHGRGLDSGTHSRAAKSASVLDFP